MIVKQFILHYCQQLARIDVELLLCHALSKPRSWLLAHDLDSLTLAQQRQAQALIERRLAGEPVAYILGYRDFWDVRVEVSPDTLIPRPDTEVLVETALPLLEAKAVVADVGTGTGAIAIAIAREKPLAHVLACDFQFGAAQLAARNSLRTTNGRVAVWQGSWLTAIAPASLDMVVGNPPYIDASDPHLGQGDVRFEPRSALVAANQGLADIALIAEQALTVLKPGGWLLLEHGWQQGSAVAGLFNHLGYQQVRSVDDYGGNPRVTLGRHAC